MNTPNQSELVISGKASQSERMLAALSCLFLFLCMAYPTVSALVVLKGSVFAVVLALIILKWLADCRPILDWRVAYWTIGLAIVGFFFVLEGLVNGTPGAVAVMTVYVLWPLVFTVWAAGLSRAYLFAKIEWTVVIATLFIGVYGCTYLLTQLNVLPYADLVGALSFGWSEQAFGAYEGYTQLAIAGMNSLPFLLPFVMARVAIDDRSDTRSRWLRVCAWAALVSGSAIVFVSGRRALMLAILLTPAFIWFFRAFQPAPERVQNRRPFFRFVLTLAVVTIFCFVVFGTIYQFEVGGLWERFSSGFDLGSQTSDESAVARHEQVIGLLRGWLSNPLFGAGHGASVVGSIRSEDMPWAFELTYLSLLYQTGIVGLLAYSSGVVWIFWRGIKIIKEGDTLGRIMLATLVGFLNLLIANGTNPYLLKFDGMWMLFLPVALVNYRLILRSEERRISRRSLSMSFG